MTSKTPLLSENISLNIGNKVTLHATMVNIGGRTELRKLNNSYNYEINEVNKDGSEKKYVGRLANIDGKHIAVEACDENECHILLYKVSGQSVQLVNTRCTPALVFAGQAINIKAECTTRDWSAGTFLTLENKVDDQQLLCFLQMGIWASEGLSPEMKIDTGIFLASKSPCDTFYR